MSYVEVGAWSPYSHPPGAVVVGYNGKNHSRAALLWGAREAARRDVPLLVLFAANYPGMTVEPGPGLFHRDPQALEAAEEVTGAGVVEALAAQPKLTVYGATEVTSPANALTQASADAAMIVLGSRGYGRVLGALLGSVAFAVASRAPCPVVVVKDECSGTFSGVGRPVVVGTDGSSEAMVAVEFAAHQAAAAEAPLRIMTCTGGQQVADVPPDDLRASAKRIAAEATAHALEHQPALTTVTRVEDRPAEAALIKASAEAGLVVVGTRGRGAFEAMMLGSVSHAVIYGAFSPVAVV